MKATAMRARNSITRLFDENGVWCDSKEDVHRIIERGVSVDVTCASCSKCPETTIDTLWGCAKLKEVQNVVAWSTSFLAAYEAANDSVVDDQRCLGTIEEARWRPSTKLMYKINTNASIQAQSNCMGVGIVIRDRSGWVMGSSAQRIQACFTPQIAEAIAILRGIEFARDMGLLPVVVESDALGVVKHIIDGNNCTDDIVNTSDVFVI
ncbi:hypothetical protein Ddye_023199 [Dipteronia dyeriana]|uniref:RNase H type-1 domain-containing protein n=1 Tax=Dipteronia dyeriana TaxID=168575 RepID=A0AAD9TT36_9ROSI|nr:hypothetical protein Ddye_023199 [Dipteronia dyeriana]